MIQLEQKLIDNGITREQFAKEDALRIIAEAESREAIVGNNEQETEYLRKMTETFADIGGILPEFSGKSETKQTRLHLGEKGYRLYVAQAIANKMLRTLEGKPKQYQSIELDRIFNDTFPNGGTY
jgi:hypothetical protein